MSKYVVTLTIAGSDCSGGAGIQADIKTMSALGCYAASVITSLTVQNTTGVSGVMAVSPETVAGQIRAVMDDMEPAAVKIGMVNDCATIKAIAASLRAYSPQWLVVDPVMVSSTGARLMREDALDVFRSELMPMATLLTPNVPEAEVLSGMRIDGQNAMDAAGRAIVSQGCRAVLIKGGHLPGRKADRLYGAETGEFVCEDVPTGNTHGTGCTLSSAITSYLALGRPLAEAISLAKDYVTQALSAGADVRIGHGVGPVNHFFNPKKLIKL